jgi:glutamate racemase
VDERPIGMFDSGVGGLTVARAVIDLLPGEDLLYLGDTARGPFGPRDLTEVRGFVLEIVDWLVRQGVKMVVVACNTATAAALEDARRVFRVPLVGVVEPGLRAALAVTRRRRIGVVGTVGTVESGTYARALARLSPGSEVVQVACPRFVEFVERGEVHGGEVEAVALEYLAPLRCAGVDVVVLGCTHYPLLARVISDALGRDVTLISSADETAFEVADLLGRTGSVRPAGPPGRHRFVCTADAAGFRRLGRRFLGPEVDAVEQIALPDYALGRGQAASVDYPPVAEGAVAIEAE